MHTRCSTAADVAATLKRAALPSNENAVRNPIRRRRALRPGFLPATILATALVATVVASDVAADPGPDAGVATDPAGDGVDCDTAQPQSGLDAAVDFQAAAAGVTTDGELVFDLLTRGDLAAFVRRAYSAATEVSFRPPGTNGSIVAYDQQHDGVHEAQVVDGNGEPVAGARLVTGFLSPGGIQGAGIRLHIRGTKIADNTSPRPDTRIFVTFSTYSMLTTGSPRLCDRITAELVPMSLDARDLAGDSTLVDIAAAANASPPTTAAVPSSTLPAASAAPATSPPVDAGATATGEGSGDSVPWLPIAGGLGLFAALALWWWRARHASAPVPPTLEPAGAQVLPVGIRAHGMAADGSCSEQLVRADGKFED